MSRILSNIKCKSVSPKQKPRKIKTGIFQGLRMNLNLMYQTQLYLGLFEREIYKWLVKLSTGINTAIDIGAGEGEYTLYFLVKTQAKRIFVFEPLINNQVHLMHNLELNDLRNNNRLELFPEFVGSSNNENERTLDSLSSLILPPCLIKVDVEGGEVNILQGAQNILNFPQIYWIIETHSPQLEKECIQILNQKSFVVTIVSHAWWRLLIPELRHSPQNRWLIAIKNYES